MEELSPAVRHVTSSDHSTDPRIGVWKRRATMRWAVNGMGMDGHENGCARAVPRLWLLTVQPWQGCCVLTD